jgi:hypothetical protein
MLRGLITSLLLAILCYSGFQYFSDSFASGWFALFTYRLAMDFWHYHEVKKLNASIKNDIQ